jgi:redox-sensitive bicupin YhaK (pirin superfamily)
MGPVRFAPGAGLDVRPHPHIGLATVTYLFEGEILHRDSLGSVQPIRPGELNWMTAGRGIVHSERTPAALRAGQSQNVSQSMKSSPRSASSPSPWWAPRWAASPPCPAISLPFARSVRATARC